MQPDFDRIQPVVTKFAFGEQPNDVAYWLSQPPEARLAALERIRREHHRWRYGAEPSFQRVVRIVPIALKNSVRVDPPKTTTELET
ncbi:MAG: hypothetical protein WD069_01310 [Planctomycetales bacterium]